MLAMSKSLILFGLENSPLVFIILHNSAQEIDFERILLKKGIFLDEPRLFFHSVHLWFWNETLL